jgi:DNA polymerase-3 subunit gamma/tau
VLEEPPPRVVFVFATTEPQKIAQAAAPVLSRLQRFDLKRIGPAEIRERLAAVLGEEGVAFEPDALGMIARAADGGLRDALSLTDQVLSIGETAEVTAQRVQEALGLVPDEEYLALLDMVAERRAADVFGAVQRLSDAGVDFVLVLAGLGDLLRSQLAIGLGGVPPELPERLRAALEARKGRLAVTDLLRMLHALLELEPMYRKSGQPQLLLETLLVRFALLDRTVDLEEVLKGFGPGGGDDPPVRRVAHEPRVASAHALPPVPPAASAPAAPSVATATALAPVAAAGAAVSYAPVAPPVPRSATMQVASAAAAAQTAPPVRKPTPIAGVPSAPPAIEQVHQRWGAVSDALRSKGRGMVAEAMARLRATGVSAHGVVSITYAAADDTWATATENGRADVLASLQQLFPGVTNFTLTTHTIAPAATAAPPATKRLTAHDVQQQRTAQMAAKHPVLEAAVNALELELLD